MPVFNQRGFDQTKGTQQLSFIAGETLLPQQYVKRQAPLSQIVVDAVVESDAIGYVLNLRTVNAGEVVDVQMISDLEFVQGGGGGGSVNSVTDDGSGVTVVDNTDPANPIVGFGGVNVDGTTITGDGTVGNPLSWVGSVELPVSNIAFVTPSGDDATGTVGRFDLPFQTLDGAINAGNGNTLVYAYAGTYSITPYTLDGTKPFNFYFAPNAILTSNDGDVPFLINVNQQLNIRGHCQFAMRSHIWQNNLPSGGLVFVTIECESLDIAAGAGSPEIADLSSWKGFIKANRGTQCQFIGEGYMSGTIALDEYTSQEMDMFILASPASNNATLFYSTQGFPKLVACGRNKLLTRINMGGTDPRIVYNSTSGGNKLFVMEIWHDAYFQTNATIGQMSEGIFNVYGMYRGNGSTAMLNYATDTGQGILNVQAKIRSSGEQLIADVRRNGRYTFRGQFYADQSTVNPAFNINSSSLGIQIQFDEADVQSSSSPCLDVGQTAGHPAIVLQFKDTFLYTFSTTESIRLTGQPINVRIKNGLTTSSPIDADITNITPQVPIYTSSQYVTTAEDF